MNCVVEWVKSVGGGVGGEGDESGVKRDAGINAVAGRQAVK